jgi:hypothetical protein
MGQQRASNIIQNKWTLADSIMVEVKDIFFMVWPRFDKTHTHYQDVVARVNRVILDQIYEHEDIEI